MPVREAVQRLETEGYIQRIPMKGYIVCGLEPREIAHVYAMRCVLEPLAAHYVALRASKEELDSLENLLVEAEKKGGIDAPAALESYLCTLEELNQIFFSACRSKVLLDQIWTLREKIDRFRVMRSNMPSHHKASLQNRKALYKACRDRNPELAFSIWRRHLIESFLIWRNASDNVDKLDGTEFPWNEPNCKTYSEEKNFGTNTI
jgi:DNA-binding GntR family transcriptional regulator